MVEIFDVENENLKKQYNRDPKINGVLSNNSIFILQVFIYAWGYSLFNEIKVLFHFHYWCNEIQNGIIHHFLMCLLHDDIEEK